MPISGPASYPPTVAQFISHWNAANAALGDANPLVLVDNVLVRALEQYASRLLLLRDAVTDAALDRALARETLTQLITRLQGRLVEFNDRVRADLPKSTFVRVLPTAFQVGDAENTVREAVRQMRGLWTKINAIAPVPPGLQLPLMLREGYLLSVFEADVETLRVAYRTLTEADLALRLAREDRNDLQDVIYEVLKNYRLKLPTAFPIGHAMVDALPALRAGTGHTPDAVVLQVVFDAPTAQAKATWTASTESTLDHYEVRGVPGDAYNSDDESVLATVPPGAPREFATTFGLGQPGLTAGFKVYVVLQTGNEKGSDPVYVTRP